MVGVFEKRREGRDDRLEDKVEVLGDLFSGARASGDNRSAGGGKGVQGGFVDFG